MWNSSRNGGRPLLRAVDTSRAIISATLLCTTKANHGAQIFGVSAAPLADEQGQTEVVWLPISQITKGGKIDIVIGKGSSILGDAQGS
jgi:hypothetical protein